MINGWIFHFQLGPGKQRISFFNGGKPWDSAVVYISIIKLSGKGINLISAAIGVQVGPWPSTLRVLIPAVVYPGKTTGSRQIYRTNALNLRSKGLSAAEVADFWELTPGTV